MEKTFLPNDLGLGNILRSVLRRKYSKVGLPAEPFNDGHIHGFYDTVFDKAREHSRFRILIGEYAVHELDKIEIRGSRFYPQNDLIEPNDESLWESDKRKMLHLMIRKYNEKLYVNTRIGVLFQDPDKGIRKARADFYVHDVWLRERKVILKPEIVLRRRFSEEEDLVQVYRDEEMEMDERGFSLGKFGLRHANDLSKFSGIVGRRYREEFIQ